MALVLQETKVSKAVSLVLSTASKKKTDDVLSEGVMPVQMQIGVKKIPKELKRMKLKLPHPIAQSNQDICLFVKDVDKSNRDTEPTVTFYQELFAKKGVKNIKEIVPVQALKTDYKPYEAKWNLSNAYDAYLADERVVECLPRLLGKSFYGRKRDPTQLDLGAKDLAKEINRALNVSKLAISNKGNTSMALVGHSEMSPDHLTANVMAAANQVASSIPGTADNIKQLSIKAKACTSIPIYMTEGGPQDVKIQPKKTEKEEAVIDELSSMPDAQVAVYPSGKVLIIREGQTLKQAKDLDRKRKQDGKARGGRAKKAKFSKSGNTVTKRPKAKVVKKKIK